MFWHTYQRLANQALTEAATELGVLSEANRGFGWSWHLTPPQTDEVERFCSDFEDSRGTIQICVPNGLSERETKEEIKRQIIAHGIVPARR